MGLLENTPEHANKLSPKSVIVNRIIFAVVSVIPIIIGIVAFFNSDKWYPLFIMLAVAILFFSFGFIWSKKRYQYSRWWFEDEGLYIQKGVIWRRRILVPKNRVQHTDVSQGPLERKFELGQLKVNTAGTKDASVDLSGVELEVANALRNRLIDETASDAV
ncbi:MAG: PH domain-containing protein [Gammaproteobacteria bacterium]|nr:PH domain-containing protein [Gammaproteobacteria bacterium]